MEGLLRRNGGLADAWAGASGFLAKRAAPKLGPVAPCDLLWWIFTASVTFSVAADYAGDVGAPMRYIFAIGGSAGCGWLWLQGREGLPKKRTYFRRQNMRWLVSHNL